MRGVAAILVILYHCGRHMEQVVRGPVAWHVFQFGHAGVDLFFVLSGFIILHVHMQDVGRPQRLRHYAARRFTRVMPTYWVALAATLTIGLAAGMAGGVPLPPLDRLFWSVTLLPADQPLILGIAWTLRHELLFYAIFAVAIASRTCGVALFVAWAMLIAINLLVPLDRVLPSAVVSVFNMHFFLGMGVAWCAAHRQVPGPRWILAAGVVLFLGMGLMEDAGLASGYTDAARLAYGVPSALIVLGIVAAHREDGLRVPALLARAGGASYSLYIFQFVFIGTAWQVLRLTGLSAKLPPPIALVILAAAAIGGGLAAAAIVERPLIRLFRSLGGTSRRDAGLPAP